MPCHMSQRTIDDEEEENHEEHICREAYTFCKRTGNQRRCNDGKLHLKQGKERQRYRCTTQDVSCRCGIDLSTNVLKHQERQRIANDTTDVVAKAQRETDDHPQHRNQSHSDKRLEHRRNYILRSYHAAVEERQTWRHHQHENRGCNQPSHISCRDY